MPFDVLLKTLKRIRIWNFTKVTGKSINNKYSNIQFIGFLFFSLYWTSKHPLYVWVDADCIQMLSIRRDFTTQITSYPMWKTFYGKTSPLSLVLQNDKKIFFLEQNWHCFVSRSNVSSMLIEFTFSKTAIQSKCWAGSWPGTWWAAPCCPSPPRRGSWWRPGGRRPGGGRSPPRLGAGDHYN